MRDRERGFSLVELIVAVSILGLIMSAVSMVVVVMFRTMDHTSDRLNQTRGPRFASVYWVPDVASAEVVNPSTAPSVCGAAGPMVTFRWTDDRSGITTVSWAVETAADAKRRLVRRLCENGSTTVTRTTVVAPDIANPGAAASCAASDAFGGCTVDDTDRTVRLSLVTAQGASFEIDGVREVGT